MCGSELPEDVGADRHGPAPRRRRRSGERRSLARRGFGPGPGQGRAPAAQVIELLSGNGGLPDRLRGGVVALGNFDGIHRGHQAVIERAVMMARDMGVAAVVGTFDPHPRRFFRPEDPPFRLTSLEHRMRLLGTLGVDAMMVFDFDGPLAAVTPEQFVDQCLRNVGGIVTGADFAFGRARSGDVRRLGELGAERGIACIAIDKLASGECDISSSRIRRALAAGDCAEACRLLTRPFAVEGVLRRGQREDPHLPLLDASIDLGEYVRPRRGVYAVRATVEGGRRLGGSAFLQPTPEDDLLELFLVDVEPGDLDRRVTIEFIAHLHDAETIFDPPALRRVIQTDRETGNRMAASPDQGS